jgi:hypothetical protein
MAPSKARHARTGELVFINHFSNESSGVAGLGFRRTCMHSTISTVLRPHVHCYQGACQFHVSSPLQQLPHPPAGCPAPPLPPLGPACQQRRPGPGQLGAACAACLASRLKPAHCCQASPHQRLGPPAGCCCCCCGVRACRARLCLQEHQMATTVL